MFGLGPLTLTYSKIPFFLTKQYSQHLSEQFHQCYISFQFPFNLFPLQPQSQEHFFHFDEFRMMSIVMTIEHPANEMRNNVLTICMWWEMLFKEISVECVLLRGLGEGGKWFYPPRWVQVLQLLVPERFELLKQKDAPGWEAHHFVSSGFFLERAGIDEGVDFVHG